MTRVALASRLTATVAVITSAVGCSPSSSLGDEKDINTEALACTAGAVRYHAFLRGGSCADVPGSDGRWRSRVLFPDAPEEIRRAGCTYEWHPSAAVNAAVADVDALRGLGAEFLTKSIPNDERVPVCEARPLPLGSLKSTLSDSGAASAPTGVTGCEVCGRVLGRTAFVILPEDRRDLRTILVMSKDGFVSFEVARSDATPQVFSVDLPPPSSNVEYTPGRLLLLGAPF